MRSASLLLVISCAACASALREPPPLETIAAASTSRVAPDRLGEADLLYEERTMESVQEAESRFQAAVDDDRVRLRALIGATRCKLWIGGHHDDPDVRLTRATEAVDLAQWCGRVAPDDVECDYLLALSLGLQAQERRSTGMDALPRIERLLQRVAERAPLHDFAGPDRVLALVYLRAPGWPTGPGDDDLGLEHARKAVELVPDYPPNRLALAEALTKTGDRRGGREEYREAARLAALRFEQDVPDAGDWLEDANRALERMERR